MKYFVFRVNYEDAYYPMLRREALAHGRLRQGWGAEGMSLLQSKDGFIHAWRSVWGEDSAAESYMIGKRNTLGIIQEMEAGDLIVVPKMRLDEETVCPGFTIMERTEEAYSFAPVCGDFGHIVPVKPLVSFSYTHNDKSRTVSAKFKAYQRPINRVYADEFCEAVDSLLREFHEHPDACKCDDLSSVDALYLSVFRERQAYLEKIVNQINQWQPIHLERVIEELFVKNGYIKRGNNHYDRKGGDIDLLFDCFVPNTFMADLYSFSDHVHMPEIRVQVKNKRGLDDNDFEGIEQLIRMVGSETAINILINTTKEFSEKAKYLAAEHHVILINGTDLATMLVKYGMDSF